MRRKRKQQKRLLEERLRDLQRLEALEAAAQAEGEGPEGRPQTAECGPLGQRLTHHLCPFPQTLAQD